MTTKTTTTRHNNAVKESDEGDFYEGLQDQIAKSVMRVALIVVLLDHVALD